MKWGDARFYFFDPIAFSSAINWYGWIIAGLLVGLGARMVHGDELCHVMMGAPSLHFNSMVAFAIMYFSASLMGNMNMEYKWFIGGSSVSKDVEDIYRIVSLILLALFIVLTIVVFLRTGDLSCIFTACYGALISFGMMCSGLARPSKMLAAFHFLGDNWSPGVLLTYLFVFLVNFLLFKCFVGREFGPSLPGWLSFRNFIGSGMFGLGWGITGLGPGAGLINFFIMPWVVVFVVFMIIGVLISDWLDGKQSNSIFGDGLTEPLIE